MAALLEQLEGVLGVRTGATIRVIDPIADRWSPRAFSDRDISEEDFASMLEAARWAASSFNEQPWRFLFARRGEGHFADLCGWLSEGNREWAQRASVVGISIARMTFTKNEKPNRHAYHDVGLAVSQMFVQATALGIAGHQMAGFDRAKASAEGNIVAPFEPVAMLVFGYLPDGITIRERTRKPVEELVYFSKSLGTPGGTGPGSST